MFQVCENNKPCDTNGFPKLTKVIWGSSIFKTFAAAHEYALKWMGEYGNGVMLELNKPYDISGYGDMIEIREVK